MHFNYAHIHNDLWKCIMHCSIHYKYLYNALYKKCHCHSHWLLCFNFASITLDDYYCPKITDFDRLFCNKENAFVFLDNPVLSLFLSSCPCLWTDGCVCDAGWMGLNCSQGKGNVRLAVSHVQTYRLVSNYQIKIWLAFYWENIT